MGKKKPSADTEVQESGSMPGMIDALVPAFLRESAPARLLGRLSAERRGLLLVVAFAGLIFLPFLGSVGLWDPWETHYSEVARSMIERNDYVHPYWERAYFFSKPVLTFWLMALGMKIVGLAGPGGALSIYLEWAVRLPIALLAILGVAMVYLAGARIWSRRVGALAAVALATMPMYGLIARQAMTDMPFVSLVTAAICALMIALFGKAPAEAEAAVEDEEATDDPDPFWLYVFYAFVGFATLAKGLLGVALPGAVALLFLVLTGRWGLVSRLRIPTGALLTAVIGAPWFVVMSLFNGKDDEFKNFAYRFFVHDHFKRIGMGVHTTTPGGTFTYFIEQVGFGTFPWVVLFPASLTIAARDLAAGLKGRRAQALFFAFLWILVGYGTFSLSATKFHHYGFPMLPPLALVSGYALHRIWEEGIRPHQVALLLGVILFVVIAQNLAMTPKHLADLYVYNYGRPYPSREVDPRRLFAVFFVLGGLLLVWSYFWQRRRSLVAGLLAIAFLFSAYLGWVHWVQLSPHWSQRDLFWTYYQTREGDEPIAAYYMNWRGETLYSQNSVVQIKDAGKLRKFVAEPGAEYVLVEQGRYKGLRSVLSRHRAQIVDRTNNKYYLVRVEDPL
ncbi:MAG: glycosyltransferase family 39 protein [Deltaproteobacteria bacterium]|nr:glycosyltransferase family 39 protein [Deltaproteobacteria bacterium]